jgi:hypothetical protein
MTAMDLIGCYRLAASQMGALIVDIIRNRSNTSVSDWIPAPIDKGLPTSLVFMACEDIGISSVSALE